MRTVRREQPTTFGALRRAITTYHFDCFCRPIILIFFLIVMSMSGCVYVCVTACQHISGTGECKPEGYFSNPEADSRVVDHKLRGGRRLDGSWK